MYTDNVIVGGVNKEDHIRDLRNVFQRLIDKGLLLEEEVSAWPVFSHFSRSRRRIVRNLNSTGKSGSHQKVLGTQNAQRS